MSHAIRGWMLVGIALALGSHVRGAEADVRGVEFFEKKIRPVLVEHCYRCHSVQAKKVKGELLLDTRQGVRKGGESGPVVVPGKPEQSLLLKALRYQQDDLKMPPAGRLPDAVIADFTKWIQLGVPDPRDGKPAQVSASIDFSRARAFWALRPPRPPALPEVKNKSWPRSAFDRFILARLEARGLQPVKPADKRTLLRRATLDLIGLPPTPEELDAFLKDTSPDAFANVVDRLLSSPHYGERWGRYWLDVARYAEDQAHTFAVKPYTQAFRYRDWVIAAFNADMPYDKFIEYQLAADLMDGSEAERIANLPALGFCGLGAQYYKGNPEAIAQELDDRVDTVTRGFLGLTVSCARCHDHKFDPIPTQDYYSLAGVFHSSKLEDVPLAPRETVRRYREAREQYEKIDTELKSLLNTERARLSEPQAAQIASYMVASWKYQLSRRANTRRSIPEQARQNGLDAGTLERWVKYLKGNPKVGALEPWRQLVGRQGGTAAREEEVLAAAQKFQQHVQLVLTARAKRKLDKNQTALLQALFGNKGLFGLSDNDVKARLPAAQKRKADQLQARRKALEKVSPMKKDPPFPVAHGLTEGSIGDMNVYLRGDPARQGALAPRRFLRVLARDNPAPFRHGSGRLDLARAIAARDNPLTARVMANRIWQHHFGRGLVGTPSNFGKLGELPSHPELLDYLACRFTASGWSIKALHREIMLSATYHLGSDLDRAGSGVDADNRLLWRMSRRRLDVEAWRDAMLAVAGKLDRTRGGPTFDLNSVGNCRRTVYAKVSRHDLAGLLRLFDFPDANITSEKRTETTVPQQQLFALNSPFVVEQARALAARVKREAASEPARIQRAFLLAYGRPAAAAEADAVHRFLAARDSTADAPKNKLTRWERFAQVLLGSNEFAYID
jgi:hypothetical protein